MVGTKRGSLCLLGVDSISVSDKTFIVCPILLPHTFRKQEGGMAWAHRLYNILRWIPERGGLPGCCRPVLSVTAHRQREFSDQRAACTCQAGADWAVGLWPIKAVEHSQADSPLLS